VKGRDALKGKKGNSMTAKELKIGAMYRANVNGAMRLVRLVGIHHEERFGYTSYYVRNLETGRDLTFNSPRKFQRIAEVK
jgi:hypothetical protein